MANQTAWKNLSGDALIFWNFWDSDKVAAFGQLLSGVAICIGVWVAYRQLYAWRDELKIKKRAEVAEELLAKCLAVSDSLKALRSIMDSIPIEETDNRKYIYEKRYKRFVNQNELFVELRRAQVRAEAVLINPEIDANVNVLFDVRQRAMTAIDLLSGDWDSSSNSPEDNEMYRSLKKDMYGSYTEKHDPLGMEQLKAIKQLKIILGPSIRLEA